MNSIDGTPIQKLLIVGAGGSGREVAWLARDVLGYKVELAFAVEPQWATEPIIDDLPVIILDDNIYIDATHYIIALGDISARRRLAIACDHRGLIPATLVHPSVIRSPRTCIGAGSLICAGSVVTTNVHIGRHVHINIGCTVSHDVTLGDFTTLSPGVHISGHVHTEDDVFLGTGANVINGTPNRTLTLGQRAVIAAGACVIQSVVPGSIVAGVPAERKH